MTILKHPVDLVLPIAFAGGGLFWSWITGRWFGVSTVGVGYLSVFVITSFVLRRAIAKRQP